MFPPIVKKTVMWGLVLFALYAITHFPTLAADTALTVWDTVVGWVENIASFFDELLRG